MGVNTAVTIPTNWEKMLCLPAVLVSTWALAARWPTSTTAS